MSRMKAEVRERMRGLSKELAQQANETSEQMDNITSELEPMVTPPQRATRGRRRAGNTERLVVRVDASLQDKILSEVFDRKRKKRPNPNIQGVLLEILLEHFAKKA